MRIITLLLVFCFAANIISAQKDSTYTDTIETDKGMEIITTVVKTSKVIIPKKIEISKEEAEVPEINPKKETEIKDSTKVKTVEENKETIILQKNDSLKVEELVDINNADILKSMGILDVVMKTDTTIINRTDTLIAKGDTTIKEVVDTIFMVSKDTVFDLSVKYASTITSEEMKSHVYELTSDYMQGRGTGQPGGKRAARYIGNQFLSLDLPKMIGDTSYYQKIPLQEEKWLNVDLNVYATKYTWLKDYYSFIKSNRTRKPFVVEEVVFVGYGIETEEYNDYKGIDVTNKVVIMLQEEPKDENGVSYITGKKEMSKWAMDWKKKLKHAKKKGARLVLFIEKDIPFFVDRYQKQLKQPILKEYSKSNRLDYVNAIYISEEIAKDIIDDKWAKFQRTVAAINATGRPKSMTFRTEVSVEQKKDIRVFEGDNVLGYIEGSDPKLKEELVIVTAHYDHLGIHDGETFYGADDNASGTSALIEMAEAFKKAKDDGNGPKRSVLIMPVGAEEIGLIGSKFYTDNPEFPLYKTVADLNVDMIGRVDAAHTNDPNYIYVIGADRISQELHDINEAMNEKYTKIGLDYTYNAEDDPNRYYFRSDHYNFAKNDIPSVFFFSGVHKDYHKSTDTPDKLNYNRMEKITKLVFHTTWELANRKDRIKSNK